MNATRKEWLTVDEVLAENDDDDMANMAQRHRFGRALDDDRPPIVSTWEGWLAIAMLLAWVGFLVWALTKV